MDLYKNKNWLKQRYNIDNKTQYEIADECGVSQSLISIYVKRFNLRKINKINITSGLIDFLNGELLGDGHLNAISKNKKDITSIRYQHGSSKREYLIWLSKKLSKFGLEQSGIIRERKHYIPTSIGICTDYHYSTKSYRKLIPYYNKWYNNKIKIIPEDLELTPITLRQWYIGDGFYNNRKDIGFSSYNFSKSEVKSLIELLDNIGIKSSMMKSNGIHFSRYSIGIFFDYIGPCPEEIKSIYGYKWPTGEEMIEINNKVRLKNKYGKCYWRCLKYLNSEDCRV